MDQGSFLSGVGQIHEIIKGALKCFGQSGGLVERGGPFPGLPTTDDGTADPQFTGKFSLLEASRHPHSWQVCLQHANHSSDFVAPCQHTANMC